MESETALGPYWWVYAVAGAAAILFGIAAIVWPGLTLALFVLIFGVFVIVDGAVALIDMFQRMTQRRTWWPQLIIGVIGIAAGLFVFAYPVITAVLLLYIIAFWALVDGIVRILVSLATGHFLTLVVGMLTIVFGLILLENPVQGAMVRIAVIGAFAIVRGILQLIEAIRAPSPTAMSM